MSLVLTDIQKVELSISPTNAAGNPAPIDGAVSWSVSDPSIGGLTVSEDGLSAEFATTGKLGSCQVNVSADADVGEGVTSITGVLEVTITASQATSLGIAAGLPVAK